MHGPLPYFRKNWIKNLHTFEEEKVLYKCINHNFIIVIQQAQMPDPKTYKQHFENKHPKNDMPDDLKSIWRRFS